MMVLHKTQSLCPQCLRVIDAQYISQINQDKPWVYLQKQCPEHGYFSTPIWVDLPNTPSFKDWYKHTLPQHPALTQAQSQHGCPYDCGLCPKHAQSTCCALIEVTKLCNLSCPICYANSNESKKTIKKVESCEPSLQNIAIRLKQLLAQAGPVNIQLSGGEPTIRNDLQQIITLAKNSGFNFIQLNTNGIRLGSEKDYAHKLKAAGLSVVYLQWDDIQDSTYIKLRGKPCAEIKQNALEQCIAADLPVILVATIVHGVNHMSLGAIIQKAIACGPLVRGVHIQPVSSFGRYPWLDANAPRITIPEILHNLEVQCSGMIRAQDFQPPNSEHALCSFNALYIRNGSKLEYLNQSTGSCCSEPTLSAKRAQNFVAQHWGICELSNKYDKNDFSPTSQNCNTIKAQANNNEGIKLDSFDKTLEQIQYRFTLSGMAFQDVYTLDLERLRRCHIHIMNEEQKLMPFCAYNLTSNQGFALYRK